MGTATAQTFMETLKTGADLKYPVVMKCPFDITPYKYRLTIAAGETTLKIGDICEVITTTKTLGKVTSASTFAAFIVLYTEYNKSVLEAAGSVVAKSTAFAAGVKIDVLLLVPGMILSVKAEAKADIDIGTKLIANDTDGQVTGGTTDGAILGLSLSTLDWTDVADETFYIPMLVTH